MDIDSIWSDAQSNVVVHSDFYFVQRVQFASNGRWAKGQFRAASTAFFRDVLRKRASQSSPPIRQPIYAAKIALAMPLSRSLTLDGVTYTGIAVSCDTTWSMIC